VGRWNVPVSNPEKVFFPEPGLTKGDLVAYYLDVAECALPHLRRRPFHMSRFPNGVEGDFFHQKRVPAKHPEYVDEVPVSFPSGHSTVFAIVDNAAALAWVANLGCIELHTWHSRVPEIERPDYLLIDLDPTSDGQWPFVREIALVVREVMDELGLASFPKTSGATGLHILAPIRAELRFPEVRRFAKALAERRDDHVAGRRPSRRVRRLRPELAGQDHRLRLFGSPDVRRSRFGTARVGRGRRRRPGSLHGADDARKDRGRRRPDARHVAAGRLPGLPLREARPRPAVTRPVRQTP
jgi:DNA ligase D-like protein (predicted polymerase)